MTLRRQLTIAYDGTAYAGWQVQVDRPTIQGTLEAALEAVLGESVRITGSGRTDAGVHALGQVAHLDDPRELPVERLAGALNATLPADIRVRDVRAAPAGFHALASAREKTYFYQLHLARVTGGQAAVQAALPPWRRQTFHPVRADLDRQAMRAAAAHLIGRHDFSALSKSMEVGRGTVRTVRAIRILRIPHGLRIFVTGDGFLYGMVRRIAGLLVEVGRGHRSSDDVPQLVADRDRTAGPVLLPAQGLFLWKVRYADAVGGAGSCYPGDSDPPTPRTPTG